MWGDPTVMNLIWQQEGRTTTSVKNALYDGDTAAADSRLEAEVAIFTGQQKKTAYDDEASGLILSAIGTAAKGGLSLYKIDKVYR